jgi:hypothetical protein
MIPLKEVRFFEVVPFAGRSDLVWIEEKVPGLKITEVDGKVLLEKEGCADVMVYPAMIKYAVAKEDFGLIVGSKKREEKVEAKVVEARVEPVKVVEPAVVPVAKVEEVKVEPPKVEPKIEKKPEESKYSFSLGKKKPKK